MKKSLLSIWFLWLLGFILYGCFFIRPYRVDGNSMETFLKSNSVIIVNTWLYRIRRGDIVVYTLADTWPRIKRVIGVGKEVIKIWNWSVFVDDKKISEKYINQNLRTCVPWSCIDLGSKIFPIPDNSYFVLGDNRENSRDSRGCLDALSCKEASIYYVSKEDIIGKYLFTLPSF